MMSRLVPIVLSMLVLIACSRNGSDEWAKWSGRKLVKFRRCGRNDSVRGKENEFFK